MDKQAEPTKNRVRKCRFLLIMSFLTLIFLSVLNIYIGYLAVKYFFFEDGWSFLAGIWFLLSYIITIPVLIFSARSFHGIRNAKNIKYTFPVFFGIAGILAGFILNNATELWIYLVIFSVLLLLSCFICGKDKQDSPETGQKDKSIADIKDKNIALSSSKNELKANIKNHERFKIVKAFQIVGLLTLFIITAILFISKDMDNSNNQLLGSVVSGFLFLVHLIVTTAFFKAKKWALNFKYYESYVLLVITAVFFLIAVIAEGISATKTFLLIVSFFIFLILLLVYLLHSYKKLRAETD